jgi:hypothetical protein
MIAAFVAERGRLAAALDNGIKAKPTCGAFILASRRPLTIRERRNKPTKQFDYIFGAVLSLLSILGVVVSWLPLVPISARLS